MASENFNNILTATLLSRVGCGGLRVEKTDKNSSLYWSQFFCDYIGLYNNSLTAVPSFLATTRQLCLWREGRDHYYLTGPVCGCDPLLRWNSIILTFMQVLGETTENPNQNYRGMPTPRVRYVLRHWFHTVTQARNLRTSKQPPWLTTIHT